MMVRVEGELETHQRLENVRDRIRPFLESLQKEICDALEIVDSEGHFSTDSWERSGGGGGITRVLENGKVFEKAGVNFSAVWGVLPEPVARELVPVQVSHPTKQSALETAPAEFFATGLSVVIHPLSPMVPTVHANYRYIELNNGDAWFGGGSDLTPYYLFDDDVIHFHSTLKSVCDVHDPDFYHRFKTWCDEYFTIKHRNERRGVGGIFFDYLRGDGERHLAFLQSVSRSFLDSYLPIVKRRIAEPWSDRERRWQLIRRGRYVEFNLVYDRGTMFGLETDGRTESILISLPPHVSWAYDHRPEEGTPEARLVQVLKNPRRWLSE